MAKRAASEEIEHEEAAEVVEEIAPDEVAATEEVADDIETPEPSYADKIGLTGDEWKDLREKEDPVEIGKALRDQLARKEEEFEQRLQQRQQQWQQQLHNRPDFIQFRRHQEELASKPPQPEVDPLAEWWKPPQFDREMLAQWTQKNAETGETEFKPDTPHEVKLAYAQNLAYTRKWWNEFESDPRGKLMPLVETRARAIATEQVKEIMRQEREQAFFENFEAQYGSYLYETDQFGQSVLSPFGARLMNEANAIYAEQADNKKDRIKATNRALNSIFGEFSLQERMRASQTEDAGRKHEEEKDKALLPKKRNSRSGSLSHPENPRKPPQTIVFADLLAQEMDAAGMDDAYFQSLGN